MRVSTSASTMKPKELKPGSTSSQGGDSNPRSLLGGSGDLVTRLIMGIIEVTIWVIRVINLLTKSP